MATVPEEVTTEAETHRKPPFLRRVRIRNYKSIKFCDVTLEPLTVLVGRNGSGKSNFVDALAFLRDVIEGGASQAVRRHGGRNRIVSRGDLDGVISFEVEAIIPRQPEGDWQAWYRISLSVEPQHPARVISESLRMAYPGQQAWSEFARNGDRVTFGTAKQPDPRQIAYNSNQSLLGHRASISALNFMTRSCGVQTYNFRPDLIRQPQPSNPEQVLEATGRNLASVLGSIEAVQPTILNRVAAR